MRADIVLTEVHQVIALNTEAWAEEYMLLLGNDGSESPIRMKVEMDVLNRGTRFGGVFTGREVSVCFIDPDLQFEDMIKNNDFDEYHTAVQDMHLRLQSVGLVEALHITEAAARTHLGKVMLLTAHDNGVAVIEIPTDLSQGLEEPQEAKI